MAISHTDGQNSGIISKLHIIPHASVTWPSPFPHLHGLTLSTLTTSENFLEIQFVPSAPALLQGSPSRDAQGLSHAWRAECVVNKYSSTVNEQLESRQHTKFIALVELADGGNYLLGTPDQWCWLSWGAQVQHTSNLYRVELTTQQSHPLFKYTGTFTTS